MAYFFQTQISLASLGDIFPALSYTKFGFAILSAIVIPGQVRPKL